MHLDVSGKVPQMWLSSQSPEAHSKEEGSPMTEMTSHSVILPILQHWLQNKHVNTVCCLKYVCKKSKGTPNKMEAFNRLQSTRKSAHIYLVRPKGTQYWQQTLHSANTNTKQTWRYDDKLLDNTILNSSPQLTCSLITSLKLSRRLELFKTFNNYNLLVQPLILSCVCCLECHKCLHCCHIFYKQSMLLRPTPQVTHSPCGCSRNPLKYLQPSWEQFFSTSLSSGELSELWKHAISFLILNKLDLIS